MLKFVKPRRSINRVFIHCSASDNPEHDNVATMDRWHKGRGWSGVGYHFFIRKDGTVERGRDINKIPAAQRGHNTDTIAICLHGLEKSKFTVKQKSALIGLCQQINDQCSPYVTFHGHNEVANKACPVIDYKSVLNLNSDGKMGNVTKVEQDKIDKIELGEIGPGGALYEILMFGSLGLHVEHLQRRLVELGYRVGDIDGKFFRQTRLAVLAFQADNHLDTDGRVGELTWEVMESTPALIAGYLRKGETLTGLAKNGSRTADASIKGVAAGVAVPAISAMGFVGQYSDTFQEIKSKIDPIAQSFGGLGTIALVGLLVVVAFMTWQLFRAGRARLDDHRTGKTV